jgi:hypothetical protein
MRKETSTKTSISIWRVVQIWWPLAASWLLMSAELPAITAIVARLPDPEINLAAYGGVVSPLAIIIEAPILMFLAASTTLCRDMDSYHKVRRYMMVVSAFLTIVHILIAFTPLFDLFVVQLIGIPDELVQPSRIGLMIMVPWTWSIAYRRFNQGVLIRTGNSKAVGIGSVIRLTTDILVLTIGYSIGSFPGVVVGAVAVISGVISESIFIGFQKERALDILRQSPPTEPRITVISFLKFYTPLALTSVIAFIVQPLVASALSRMPDAITSLAVWPVTSGVFFILRSTGMAYNEVVISLLDTPQAIHALRRFTLILGFITTTILIVLAATPLAAILFGTIYGLPVSLVALASSAIWVGLPIPAATVVQSWFQGNIMYSRKTRGITEAVILSLVVTNTVLWLGVYHSQTSGIYVALTAVVSGILIQTAWLYYRSRPAVRLVLMREN